MILGFPDTGHSVLKKQKTAHKWSTGFVMAKDNPLKRAALPSKNAG